MKSDPNNYWSNTSFGHPFGLWSHCPREVNSEGETVYSGGLPLTDVPVAWGARAILNPRRDTPIDLLWDRQTIYCESKALRKPFCQYLDNYVIPILQARAKQVLWGTLNEKDYGDETAVSKSSEPDRRAMDGTVNCTFTLYENYAIKVLANTNASHGYLYLIAFPQSEFFPESNYIKENEDPNFNWRTDARWTGRDEFATPPNPGERVYSGGFEGVVLNQFVMHGYRHLSVICDKVPDGNLKYLKEETRYYDSVNPSADCSDDDCWTRRDKILNGPGYGIELWPNGKNPGCYLVNLTGNELESLDNDALAV